ncbi:MAG: LysR family transcriptional regulator [Cucumibacter sp.]
MDLFNAMTVFVAVAETGGITGAAKRLGCSKAIVSRTLAQLEERLGARLLNRTTRRVSPTEAGEDYLKHCRDTLEQNAEVEGRFAQSAIEPQGRLKVTAPVSFGISHVGPLLPGFFADYPKVRIELDMTDRVVDLVEQGFDLAIRIGPTGPDSLVVRRIGETRHVLVGSPALIELMGGPPKSTQDLAGWPMLTYALKATPPAWFAHRAVPENERLRSNNGDVLTGMAEAGMGLTYLPRFLVEAGIATGKLKILLPASAYETTPIHAVYPHRRKLAHKTRVFIDFLAEKLRDRVI